MRIVSIDMAMPTLISDGAEYGNGKLRINRQGCANFNFRRRSVRKWQVSYQSTGLCQLSLISCQRARKFPLYREYLNFWPSEEAYI